MNKDRTPFAELGWKISASGIVSPEGPAADRAGNVYLVSRWTGRVVKVDPTGLVSDIVQTGGKPQSVAWLESDEMLLADAKNHALQRISLTGVLSTVADSVGASSSSERVPKTGPGGMLVRSVG